MKKMSEITNAVGRTANKLGLTAKKYAPEALVVAGIAGVITSTVMACKATTKAGEIMDSHEDQLDTIHECRETKPEQYTEEDMKKDTTIVYTQTAVKFIKLYAPAVTIGVASIVCIVGSHRILSKRNAALAAAYATVDKTFKEYRGRVVERFGKELDRELRYNLKSKEIETVSVDENGNEVITKEIVQVVNPVEQNSEFARIFDDGNPGWTKDPEHNLAYLRMQQEYLNERLKRKGHMFLNEVYDTLGFPRTKAGNIVGWIYDEKNPVGDNFIDFGLYDVNRESSRDFVNGHERSVLIDFNVDGNILDMF